MSVYCVSLNNPMRESTKILCGPDVVIRMTEWYA
ncbi:hypothetical protein CA54_43900 [Symmachiella macrocystis]|uniref:Uncharacterized protein n=1 Tax=Symmachiella macrocystis TaxID=2527985 RepID=A0A5C6BAX1_9PLAN|nr:hypothetical protein CA54_43900 [Symmachiella macrocystis]